MKLTTYSADLQYLTPTRKAYLEREPLGHAYRVGVLVDVVAVLLQLAPVVGGLVVVQDRSVGDQDVQSAVAQSLYPLLHGGQRVLVHVLPEQVIRLLDVVLGGGGTWSSNSLAEQLKSEI